MYERAEKLGMTVHKMTTGRDEPMPYIELITWMGLDTVRHKEAEKAQRLAKKGMQQQRPRRRR